MKTSKSKQSKANPSGWTPRITRFEAQLNELLNPKKLVDVIYKNRKLTRSEIDSKYMELGYQLALVQLVANACNPNAPRVDTRALDLFLKRCDLYYAEHAERTAKPVNVEPSPFDPAQRSQE